jgi:Sec-independent protein secretion pathway component TatC
MTTTIELTGVADAMHAILVKRADQLAKGIDGAADVTEYLTIVAAIMAARALGFEFPVGTALPFQVA